MMSRLALTGMLIAASISAQGAAPTYIFFDWGKGELSSDATATLDGVAAQYRAAPGPLLIDGHSVAGIAAITARRIGTVTKQISRALRRLRGQLGG